MKFVPRHNQIIGRMVMKRVLSKIIRPDETKNTTKFFLVDAVGSAVVGVQVGDVLVPKTLGQIVLDGGTFYRPWLEDSGMLCFVTDVNIEKDLVVQTEDGSKYVTFDSPEAAKSCAKSEHEFERDTVAA